MLGVVRRQLTPGATLQVFNMLQLLNMYHPDMQLLLGQHQASTRVQHPTALLSAFIAPQPSCVSMLSRSPTHIAQRPVRVQGKEDPEAVAGYFITPADPERSLLSLISTKPALWLADVVQQAPSTQQLTCYRTLVAGSGSLQASMARVPVLPFRWAAGCGPGLY